MSTLRVQSLSNRIFISAADSSDSSVGGGRNSSGSSSSGSTSADSSDDGGDGRARLTPDGGNNDWIAVDYDDDDDDEDSDDNDDGADIIATQSASDLSSDEGCAASGAPEPAPLIDTKDGSSSLNCSGDFQWIPRKGSGPRETPQTHPVAAVCQKPPLPLGKDPMRPTTMADQQVDRVPSPTELLPSKPPLSRSSSATNNNIKRRSLTDNNIPPLATSAGGDGASGSSRGAVLSGGSLDRRQRHKHHHHHHHHQQQQQQQYQQQQLYQQHHHHQNAPQSYTSSSSSSRSERDQKARSTHLTHNRSAASPPRLDDYLRMPPPHPPPGSTGGGLAANLYPPTMHGPPPPAMYYGCYCCPPPQTSYLQPQQYFAEAAAPNGGGYADTFHRRHEHTDPQRYGSSPMLVVGGGAGAGPSLIGSHSAAQRVPVLLSGSHPDLFSDGASGNAARLRHNGADRGLMSPPLPLTPQPCYPYHVMPMVPTHHTAGSGGCGNCCYTGDMGRGGFHWTPPAMIKPPDIDEKCRKLTSERDNLQLQVQVLSEQIEAQSDKITDLERAVHEKKQILSNTEDLLQRETLSRSSLETQKLELISQISEMKLLQASLERENMELRATCHFNNNPIDGKKPSYMSRMSPQPQLTSTPIHQSSNNALNIRSSPSPTPLNIGAVTNLIPTSARRTDNCAPTHESISQSPKTPPANFNRKVELHYASLPRQQYLSNGPHALSLSASSASFTAGVLPSHDKSSSSPAAAVDANANPAAAPGACATTTNGGGGGGKKGVAFGRGLSSLLGGRAKGHSVPNLADSEKIVIDDIANGTGPSPSVEGDNENQSPAGGKNKAGIKKIFGRLKRSGSGNLEDLPAGVGDFQRGGVRATATARLGWSEPHINKKPIKPFGEWDTDLVCEWLTDLGLEQYVLDARRWIKSGQQLHEAPASDLEKELQIRNPLHKKKLQLALIDVEENSSSDPFLSLAGKLDTSWVLRWLDDTGMPQYKESFLLNRIDGRVLHRLTMDDLAAMHVTSLMHVASLRRGIQVLRENRYEADCLQRRAIPGEDPQEPTPADICLWSTHRVMEWLREVDLAEYAPNLRGAGVHGGIMVLETKFTSELLATLLSIPSSKTLLRRHLNTHFKDLLGKDLIQAKREAESILGYVPLTPASKIKVPKKSHFSLKRSKSKSEADYGDLVCPLGAQSGEQLNGSALNSTMGMMRMIKLKEEDAFHLADDSADSLPNSYPQSATNSPVPLRYESS